MRALAFVSPRLRSAGGRTPCLFGLHVAHKSVPTKYAPGLHFEDTMLRSVTNPEICNEGVGSRLSHPERGPGDGVTTTATINLLGYLLCFRVFGRLFPSFREGVRGVTRNELKIKPFLRFGLF